MKFPTDCYNFCVKNYIREEIQDTEEFKISNINNQLRNLNSFSMSGSFKEFKDTKRTITSLKPEENFSNFKDISNIDNTLIDKLLNSKSLNTTNINSSKNRKNTKNTKNPKNTKNYSTNEKNRFSLSISPQVKKRSYRSIMKEMESNLENEKFLKYTNNLEVSLKNSNDNKYKKYSNSIKEIKEFMNKNKYDLKLEGDKEFRNMSIEDVLVELEANPEKLTPIPRKCGQVENKLEKIESYNIVRSAVVLRRMEYSSMLNRFYPIFNEEFEKNLKDLNDLNDKFSEIKIRYACIKIQNWWRSKFKELKIRNYIALNDVIRFFKISKVCLNVKFYKKKLLLFGDIIKKLIYKKLHKYFDEKNKYLRVQSLKSIFYPNIKSFFSTKITKSYPVNQIKIIQKIFRLYLETKIIIITKKTLKPEIFSKKIKSSYNITTIKLIKIQNKIKKFLEFNLKRKTTTPLKRHLCNRGISIFSKIIFSRYLINQVILIQRKIKTFLIIKSINSKKLNNNLDSISKSFILKNSCKACICRTVNNCICECHAKNSEDKESFFSLISDINSFRTEYKI